MTMFRTTCFCVITAVLLVPSVGRASFIYNLVPFPSDTFDDPRFSLDGGYLTTDGTIGLVSDIGHITDWSVSITSPRGSETVAKDARPGAYADLGGELFATATGLYLRDGFLAVGLDEIAPEGDELYTFWLDVPGWSLPRGVQLLVLEGDTWIDGGAAVAGSADWLIATRAVPEPSTILLLTCGLMVGGGYGIWRRKKSRHNAP